jgi:hypothetical protein
MPTMDKPTGTSKTKHAGRSPLPVWLLVYAISTAIAVVVIGTLLSGVASPRVLYGIQATGARERGVAGRHQPVADSRIAQEERRADPGSRSPTRRDSWSGQWSTPIWCPRTPLAPWIAR